MNGTGPWGQYKTPGMLGFIRAKRADAREARSLVEFYLSNILCRHMEDLFATLLLSSLVLSNYGWLFTQCIPIGNSVSVKAIHCCIFH